MITRKIRVLHIINNLKIGGAEVFLFRLLNGTNRQRFAHAVISLRDDDDLGPAIKSLGVPVYTLGMRTIPTPACILRLARTVRKTKPDVIQGWLTHGNLAAVFAQFVNRTGSLVWSVHNSLYSYREFKRFTAALMWLSGRLSRAPKVIVYCSETPAIHHEKVGYKKNKRLIFSYGFDTQEFAPSCEARASVRSELGVSPDAVLVGHLGTYLPVKDHATLIKAAAIVAKQHPNTEFVLVGRGISSSNEELCNMTQTLGLGERVHLLGKRFDIPRLTASLDISVSSSCGSEAFPLVMGEAMACGVPCVATNIGDVDRIIGSTGYLVPPRNPQALAAAIAQLIAIGRNRRAELGKAARNRIKEKYSLKSSVARYEELYDLLVQPNSDDGARRLIRMEN